MNGKLAESAHQLRVATRSADETERLGWSLATWLQGGDVVALSGDLGAGKTCFARGVARGLGIPNEVPITSPTYTLFNIYEGTREGRYIELVHFDLYRVADIDELEAAGFREYVAGEGIALVEWPERVPDALPPHHVYVHLSGRGELREVVMTMVGLSTSRTRGIIDGLAPWSCS